MVSSCCVFNCTTRFSPKAGIGFFRFPKDLFRRFKWTVAIRRKNWLPNHSSRICGKHFITEATKVPPLSSETEIEHAPTEALEKKKCFRRIMGRIAVLIYHPLPKFMASWQNFFCQYLGKPAELTDTENPDWVPSLNLGYVCDNEDDNEGKKRKRLSKDIKSEENSQSSKVNMDNYEILFNDVINPKKENLDDTTYTETAHNSSHSVCEDVSDCDPLTYYMHGLNKFSYPSCDVTHENALQSAKTLLMYMESQNDTDLADIVIIRRYMRKIKDKIKVTER